MKGNLQGVEQVEAVVVVVDAVVVVATEQVRVLRLQSP